MAGLKALREPGGRTRFLNLDEIGRLLAACDPIPYLRAFATVALNTGMRRNEILSLTRKSIDWQNRTAALTETKNGEARQVYLNDVALEASRLSRHESTAGCSRSTRTKSASPSCAPCVARASRISGFTIAAIRSRAIRRWPEYKRVACKPCSDTGTVV